MRKELGFVIFGRRFTIRKVPKVTCRKRVLDLKRIEATGEKRAKVWARWGEPS